MTHAGSCHCGRVAFEVEGEPKELLECNCSICARKGSLLWFVPREKLRLRTPEAGAATYTFNKHVIKHHFCPTCGIHPYGEANDPSGKAMAAINVRYLEGFDFKAVPVKQFDGRSI
jgi:hypothetical protein